jgi:peptide/nickel transport system substrate-binding protein
MKLMAKMKVIAIFLVAVLALTACGGGGASPSGNTNAGGDREVAEGGQKYGGIIRLVMTGDTNAGYGLPSEVASGMTAPLAAYAECLLLESSGGEISPWLATDWEIDLPNQRIVFTLRDDVKFHDGSDFNAEAVKWNIDICIESGIMNPAIIGAEVLGDYEVAVLLDNYTNAILNIFASHQFCMVSKENYETNGKQYAMDNPVGTGPFKFKEQIPGQKIAYERFDGYWQAGKPYIDTVEYISMTDVMTQIAAMQPNAADQISVLQTFAGDSVSQLLASADVYVNKIGMGPMALFPNSVDADSPMSNLKVRQAISLAIDRDALVAARGFGVFETSKQLIPVPYAGAFDNPDTQKYKLYYNPEEAKQLLTEAGYPNGFDTVIYGMAGDRDVVVGIQEQLAAIGINARLEYPESGAATELRANGWDGMLFFAFRALASISSTFRLHVDPDYQFFPSMWRPADEMRDLYIEARTSETVQPELFQQLQAMLMDGMVLIPVYDAYDSYVVQNKVKDSGFGDWGVGTIWLPGNAWIDE